LKCFGKYGSPNPSNYLYALTDYQINTLNAYIHGFDDISYLTLQPTPFNVNGASYVVKNGFATDGVSSGCWFSNWSHVDTAIMHDFTYATHPASKKKCDKVLLPSYRRWFVKLFAKAAWEASGERGALFLTRNEHNHTILDLYHDASYASSALSALLTISDASLFDDYFEQCNKALLPSYRR
jgi:hypothetical protein